MTQLYRAEPFGRVDRAEGCWVYVQAGEAVTVEGQPMVKLNGGTLAPIDGWHETETAAMAAIAHRVEAWGHQLLAQAARLRQGVADV